MINEELDQYERNAHEQAMRGTRVKVAEIEAKRDIKLAKIRDSDWQITRGFIAFFVLVAVIAVCITYATTRPVDPTELKSNQDRYELCMQVEEDESKC